MADKSPIEWTDATWNPVVGCSVTSPGCSRCYAMKLAGRLELMGVAKYDGLTTKTRAGFVWNGKVRLVADALDQPRRWKRPRNIFVNSMSDLFHPALTDAEIDQVVAEMAITDRHTYQVLTMRPDRMAAYFDGLRGRSIALGGDVFLSLNRPPANIWLGASIESQPYADARREPMRRLAAQGWRTWVSYEPALGPVDWSGWEFLSWLVSGGESGHRARLTHGSWHRATRDFCAAHDIAYLFKQWGEWIVAERTRDADQRLVWLFGDGAREEVMSEHMDIVVAIAEEHVGAPKRIWRDLWATGDGHLARRPGKRAAGRTLDGRTHDQLPVAA